MVYQYDFMATLMDMLGIDQPSRWDARPLSPALKGQAIEERPYLVYGCGIFSLQRTIRTRTHALVRTYHSGCMPLDDRYLFDMTADPNQTANVIDDNPETAGALEQLHTEWWQRWCTGPDAVEDPFLAQAPCFSYFPPDKMLERLEFCDRRDQIDDLRTRLERMPVSINTAIPAE
jgi:arylsulfatase A-like enzyme